MQHLTANECIISYLRSVVFQLQWSSWSICDASGFMHRIRSFGDHLIDTSSVDSESVIHETEICHYTEIQSATSSTSSYDNSTIIIGSKDSLTLWWTWDFMCAYAFPLIYPWNSLATDLHKQEILDCCVMTLLLDYGATAGYGDCQFAALLHWKIDLEIYVSSHLRN